VLEHLQNPIGILVALRSMAGPSALLICRFPRGNSLEAILRKGRWGMLRPFGHLHYFSLQSTKLMLHRSGWEDVSVRATGLEELAQAWRRPGNAIRWLAEQFGFGDQVTLVARAGPVTAEGPESAHRSEISQNKL